MRSNSYFDAIHVHLHRGGERAVDDAAGRGTAHDPKSGQFTAGQHQSAATKHTAEAHKHRKAKDFPMASAHEHAANEHAKAAYAHTSKDPDAKSWSGAAHQATQNAEKLQEGRIAEQRRVFGFATGTPGQRSEARFERPVHKARSGPRANSLAGRLLRGRT